MANCLQTYEEFVKNTFSPQIAIISGADCDSICSKNNLTLVDLLQPFSRLNAEISVRDPAGYAYTVSNLKLGFKDIVTPPPSQHVANKRLADVVARTHLPSTAGELGECVRQRYKSVARLFGLSVRICFSSR